MSLPTCFKYDYLNKYKIKILIPNKAKLEKYKENSDWVLEYVDSED